MAYLLCSPNCRLIVVFCCLLGRTSCPSDSSRMRRPSGSGFSTSGDSSSLTLTVDHSWHLDQVEPDGDKVQVVRSRRPNQVDPDKHLVQVLHAWHLDRDEYPVRDGQTSGPGCAHPAPLQGRPGQKSGPGRARLAPQPGQPGQTSSPGRVCPAPRPGRPGRRSIAGRARFWDDPWLRVWIVSPSGRSYRGLTFGLGHRLVEQLGRRLVGRLGRRLVGRLGVGRLSQRLGQRLGRRFGHGAALYLLMCGLRS